MNKAEREHIARVVALSCIICRQFGYEGSPAIPHHINSKTMGRKSDNYSVIPLCNLHHNGGEYGVAVHSGLKEFERLYGTERELLEQTLKELNIEN